jgi:hypothetical protein
MDARGGRKGWLARGWRAAAARRLRRDITPHVHSRAHLSPYVYAARTYTPHISTNAFSTYTPTAPMYNML